MKKLLVLAAALAMVGVLPSVAQATDRYYFGDASTNVNWPFCSSSLCLAAVDQFAFPLQESSARTVNGNTVCAYSYDNPSLNPTAVVCSSTLAVKPLNGMVSRFGASRSTVDNPVPNGRARVVY